ncbi:cyclin-like protein [Trametes versicolor FP-101664 SS1]|uniref:cyclin-like protein n=1 Tax=Trametes versicolor (strain FP-101664) TaxID=717944 RepID=UPI00046222CB|nr:cyclin-like protein [Trametes versicolor FP-101664 SS1]EIW59723.1 cyclin-like protein [Trametes versicolor FP-101664 SS1]
MFAVEAQYYRDPPQLLPANHLKFHHPYFTPSEVEKLSDKQRGKLSITQEEKARQQACGFIEAVGLGIGFPRKTIATAQNLYHRFYLFFPRKDFGYHDVSLGAMFVSSKMHDTLKKPRDILMVAYAVRFPELAAKARSMGGEIEMDPATVENDRQRLLAVERLMLESICFNFTSRLPFPYIIKISRAFGASKKLSKLAYRLTIDSFRTLVNLSYPPHVVAVGCLYLAALLQSFEQGTSPERPNQHTSHEIAATLSKSGEWEKQFQVQIADIEEIAHAVVDLLITFSQNPAANTSPATPSSPHPHHSHSRGGHGHGHAPPAPVYAPYKADQLIRLKIVMRETEHAARVRGSVEEPNYEASDSPFYRNDRTVRYMFAPADLVDDPS